MSRVRALLSAGVVAILAMSDARAADMPNLPPIPLAVERPPVVDVGTGWYLRGDVGYTWNQIDHATTGSGFAVPINNNWSSGGFLGVGAGVRMYRLRFDATLDYTPATDYQGSILRPGDVTARIAHSTALFNIYTDIVTWRGLTPYIGAGVGASYLTVSDYVNAVAPALTPSVDNSRWSTTWALMGGVSYAVSPNLMVDLGYRYLNLGYAESGPDLSGGVRLNGLSSQQVRLGARWMFNDSVATPEW